MLTSWLAGRAMSGPLRTSAARRHLTSVYYRHTSHRSAASIAFSSIHGLAHPSLPPRSLRAQRRSASPLHRLSLSLPVTLQQHHRRFTASSASSHNEPYRSSGTVGQDSSHNDNNNTDTHKQREQSHPGSAGGAEEAASSSKAAGEQSDAGGGGGAGSTGDRGSEAGHEGSGGAITPPLSPAQYTLVGGVTVLLVVGGVLYAVYDSGWLSDYMANSLLSELATLGPSTVVDLNGPGDKWQLIQVNATLRRKCVEQRYIDRLLEGLDPAEHIVEVQRMCLVILSELAHDPGTFDLLCKHEGLSRALLTSALQGAKDVSQMSFVLLKQLVANEEQRKQMMEARALQAACRAVKSDKPEVQGSASELLGALVPYVREDQIKALTADERRYVFSALANLGYMFAESGLSVTAVECFRLCLQLEPSHAMVQTALGMELLKLQLSDEAIVTLRKAVRQDPNNGEAVFHLYKTLFQQQKIGALSGEQLRQAVEQLKGAVAALQTAHFANGALQSSVHPILSPAYHLLVKAMEKAGQRAEAVQVAEEWTLYCPTEAVAHFTFGRLLLADSKPSEAEAPLQRAQRLDGSKAQTAYQLALAAYKQGHMQQADEQVKQAYRIAQQHDPALHRLLTASSAPPAAGTGTATQSPAAAPPLPVASETLLCQLDLLQAKLSIAQQRNAEALSTLQRYTAYRPHDAAALRLLALCLQADGKQAEAYATFARMMRALCTADGGDSTTLPVSPAVTASSSSSTASSSSSTSGGLRGSSSSLTAQLARHRQIAAVVDGIATACKRSSSARPQQADVKEAFELMCTQQRELQTLLTAGKRNK